MKVLIKVGGTLLDEPESQRSIARQLASLAGKHQVVVVHGGGKQVTRYLAERGFESRFVGGLRVSDSAVIDAVAHVIAGGVNTRFVAALVAEGAAAVGLSGVDGLLTRAVPLNRELQFVGKPVGTDGRLLSVLLAGGYLPVVACIAGDGQGNIYNVNADVMAVSCAIGWEAERLLFLTDVAGVKDETGRLIRELTAEAVATLIRTGAAHGGMQAKLEAAETAVIAGLRVDIASGAVPDVVARLLHGDAAGTSWVARGSGS